MAELEGTAEIESTVTPIDDDAAQEIEDALEADGGGEDDEKEAEAEPPRRRLVAELLEGQEILDEASRGDLQLVAPPLRPQTIDAGQPIYQLDLSSEEPQGELIEPDPVAVGVDPSPAAAQPASALDAVAAIPAGATAHDAVKQLMVQRDREVMAAERDGIGAYELAVGLDAFVEALVQAARRGDG